MSPSEPRSVKKHLGLDPADRSTDLLEWLYTLRDHQRKHQGKGTWLIKGAEVPWEHNRQGKMKWFLHPALESTAVRSMIVFEQEIPPNGRSGIQKTPGGEVLYILEGQGYTLLDDKRYDWAAEDVVNIPIRSDGVCVQHVNLDSRAPARFILVNLNLVDLLGVDRGATFEQVESVKDA